MTADLVSSPPDVLEKPSMRRFLFHGRGETLFGIQIVNLFLTLITLGIYSFWGRVKVRKYMMSQTELEGDRFAYHGTGKELLIGWIKVIVFIGLPLFVLTFFVGGKFFYPAILAFMPVAVVGARRYRLSRTSWRGIRFSFRGRAWDFVWLSVKGWLLSVITFSVAYPVWQNWRQCFLVSNSYFGNRKFEFDGRGTDLIGAFILHLLLTLPTFGLNWFWYWARVQRYYWNHTSFGAARFESSITGASFFGLMFINLLLLIFTLGFAWSWIQVRNARYYLDHLRLMGTVDLAGIMQDAQEATAMAEALSGFFDFDFDLG